VMSDYNYRSSRMSSWLYQLPLLNSLVLDQECCNHDFFIDVTLCQLFSFFFQDSDPLGSLNVVPSPE